MSDATHHRGCGYCGLPVGGRPDASAGPHYCCYGCRFAADITAASGDDGHARWMMTRLGLAIFFSMNVMVFTLLLWSQPDGEVGDRAAAAFYGLARHLCLLLSVPVLVLLGGPLVEDAAAELRRGRPSLNLLLVAGVAAAFAVSAWNTWRGGGHVYFEVACMVPVAVTLGRWFEAQGKLRTTAALRELERLLPERVRLVESTVAAVDPREGRPSDREVPLETVAVGDRLRILPGERVATDGRIVSGTAALDERAVTGESEPVVKQAGDPVHSGTLDLDGEIVIRVTAAPGSGTLERLVDAVTAAAAGSRAQRVADAVAAWFLPIVLLAAAATILVHGVRDGLSAGVMAGLAVVVVACPCALGLATPMALWVAAGTAARRHVLVRDGDALDRLAVADTFCFDKTGTLTTGARVIALGRVDDEDDRGRGLADASPETALAVAAGLAAGSTHVHAAAIAALAEAEGITPLAVVSARTIPGRGVAGLVGDVTVRLGSPGWAGERSEEPPDARGGGPPPMWYRCGDAHASLPPEEPRCVLAIAGRPRLAFWIAETVRPEADDSVAALRRRGRALLLSGDRGPRTAAVAARLGMEWQAPLLPLEKLGAITALQQHGHHVVMVGDGINDAPALAAADVGIALGCGADVSRWTAAVCLLRDDLDTLPWLVDLAGRTRRTIRWNLLWAFGYNAVCVPLAAAGLVHPALAAAAMVVSSLLVVGNSLRLATVDDEPWPSPPEAAGAAVGAAAAAGDAAGDAPESLLPGVGPAGPAAAVAVEPVEVLR